MNAIALIGLSNYSKVAISNLVSKFHIFIYPSYDPLAINEPSILNANEVTKSLCPSNVAITVYVSIFHSLIVLSAEALPKITPF